MIPVVTAAGARRMDEDASDSVDVLMDRAGLAVALAAVRAGAGYGRRVTVLCGPGNNGGDGYVAARYLQERGAAVEVQALAAPASEAARSARQRAAAAGVRIGSIGEPAGEYLVVDALFGGGFRRGLPEEVARWMTVDAPVVAVDVPSGLDPDTGDASEGAFTARQTVTFGALKPGHLLGEGPDRCGRVQIADIGLGPAQPVMKLVEADDAVRPTRPRRTHKWAAGSVLVVGGSPGMVGAAVLAGRAALRFGAGAVGVVSPSAEAVTQLAPELLTFPLDRLEPALERFGTVVVGPGLGGAADAVSQVLAGAARVVADADALVSTDDLAGSPAELVVTPHAGEFSRLVDADAGPDGAAELAKRLGAVVLLKGSPTFVTDGGIPWVVTSGGPELATIGTGDVLAGMIGALWARGLDAATAAFSAAYWHGVAAADLASRTTVTADALATHIAPWAGLST